MENIQNLTTLEKISVRATSWVGSTKSLAVHTTLFVFAFFLVLFGVKFDKILLVVTTIVSLEAIYLSIFIQMSVNRQTRRLREVSKDIEEIQEDVEDIAEDVGEIEKDVDEIQKDVDEIQEDFEDITEEADTYEENEKAKDDVAMTKIEKTLSELMREIQELKKTRE